MKRIFYIIVISFLVIFPIQFSFSQACLAPLTGYPPINDLGSGIFRTFQGGLYPSGSNIRPTIHNAAGKTLANQVLPLDTNGVFNASTGKIVLLSIGMSNCNAEFQDFMAIASGSVLKNPKVVLVNGAQGGQTIDSILNPAGTYWPVVVSRLNAAGVSVKQVQVIWFKEAEASPSDTTFPNYPISLKNKFKSVMGIMKTKYLNLKLCYLASRIYAGYATTALNPEPYAYYSGWSCKWLVEDQINGDTNLTYSGSTPKSPWLAWGPYLWADGSTPRVDGTTWDCPTDFIGDGTHPSAAGRNKVAMKLNTFFHTDETTKPWFLKNVILYSTLSIQGFLSVPDFNLRMRDTVRMYLRNSAAPFGVVDSSIAVIDSVTMRGAYNFYNAAAGTYYLQTKHRNSVETWSRAGGEAYFPGGLYEYNFTNSMNKAYGNNLIFFGNRFCIYSGDVDQNGTVNLPDVLLAYNDATQFVSGYVRTDVTGNKVTDLQDIILITNNSSNFVMKVTP